MKCKDCPQCMYLWHLMDVLEPDQRVLFVDADDNVLYRGTMFDFGVGLCCNDELPLYVDTVVTNLRFQSCKNRVLVMVSFDYKRG